MSIHNTDVQLRTKLHRLSCFSPYNGSDERLAHADDPVRHAVGVVIIHVLLLLIDGADRIQTFHLPCGQGFSKGQFAIYGIEVTPEISQLLSDCFAGHLGGMLATSCVFQVIFPGTLAVSAWLLPIRGIMEIIQKRLGVLSGLIEKRNILGITDIGRCTGGVHNHGAAVSACSWMIARVIIVIPGFGLFFLTLLCVLYDHLIDLTQHFRRQPLTEVHHQRWVKGQLFVIIITHLYLSDDPMTEHEFEKAFGVKRCTVHYYKVSALEKLREMLSENV